MPMLCEHKPLLLALQVSSQVLRHYAFAGMCASIAPGILSHVHWAHSCNFTTAWLQLCKEQTYGFGVGVLQS